MKNALSGPKIGLYGPWGFGNLGCAATTETMIYNVQKYIGNAEIFIFALNPKDTTVRHGFTSYPIGKDRTDEDNFKPSVWNKLADRLKSSPFSLFRKLERWIRRVPLEAETIAQTYQRIKPLDIFIITGGGQLLDFWGGAWTHPYWMLKHVFLAKLTGTKVLFLSVGAGPVKEKLSKIFFKWALGLGDYRSYRDVEAKSYVEKVIGFRRNDPVFPDLVYSLPTDINAIPGQKQRVVGIGVMAYFDPRHWPENDLHVYQAYLQKLADFVYWLVEKGYGISFLLGESIAERPVIKEVIEILEAKGVMNFTAEKDKKDPILSVSDLSREISHTDYVIASRFHNILLPTLLNKPVIALSYHPKTDALMADLGQSHFCLSIDQFDVETLKARFIELEANSEKIKQHLSEQIKVYKMALDEQYKQVF